MKCRTCGIHSSRGKPCKDCGKATCYKCMIEACCPDCWTAKQAKNITDSWTPEYLEELEKYILCQKKQVRN